MVYFLLRFGLARSPFHLFSKRRRGIPAAPRLKEIRFLKDSLVKASFISIVSALCAPQNRAGCILSVCRLLCRVLVSLHPCPPAVYKPLRRLAFPFCQATRCQQIPRGVWVFPPARNESERPLGGLLFFWNLFLLPLQCSSRGGRRTLLCSRSCTGSCRRRSVCSRHVEKMLVPLPSGRHMFFFCPSWSHRVSWSTAGPCSTCCWVSPRTLANRPAGWETACKLLLFFFLLFYFLPTCPVWP